MRPDVIADRADDIGLHAGLVFIALKHIRNLTQSEFSREFLKIQFSPVCRPIQSPHGQYQELGEQRGDKAECTVGTKENCCYRTSN